LIRIWHYQRHILFFIASPDESQLHSNTSRPTSFGRSGFFAAILKTRFLAGIRIVGRWRSDQEESELQLQLNHCVLGRERPENAAAEPLTQEVFNEWRKQHASWPQLAIDEKLQIIPKKSSGSCKKPT
jgi:hypothetical protein